MSDLLLQTKLFKPALRPSLISRNHLVDRLRGGLNQSTTTFVARMTLVSAPAGFGKTTLVSTWLAALPAVKTAWLSLDENDNDLVRFLSYLIAALQTAEPSIGEAAARLLQAPQPPAAEMVLTLAINDLSQYGRPLMLVLDDYHTITTPIIHQALAFLLDHQPPNLHLLLITRSDPPLPLSRLRARSQVIEIRANDLRFTTEEARQFLNQTMGLNISTEVLTALERRTEGWIAGLQLAALSMQGQSDQMGFVTAFTGSHRFILDYLTDEVLERRPKGTRRFLLQTSILDRLCGPLCDAVTGGIGSHAVLELLEQTNLFLISLDENRHWYRYHHLFADVLRSRLMQASVSATDSVVSIAELHLRASAWFEQQGLFDEAIRHALAAPDVEQAAALVEQNSFKMLQRSDLLALRNLLGQLPAELIQTRSRLILAQAWVLAVTGSTTAAEAWLARPESAAALNAPDLPAAVKGEFILLQGVMARFQHDDARTLALGQEVLALIPVDDQGIHAGVMYNMGVAHSHLGDMVAAEQAFHEAIILGESKGGPYMALISLQELSELYIRQARLSLALETCHQAAEMSRRWGWQAMPMSGLAYIYQGQVLYQRNDLVSAAAALAEGIRLLRGSIEQFILAMGYALLAQLYLVREESGRALETIEEGELWFSQMRVSDTGAGNLLALSKARLWIATGQLEAAARWFETSRRRKEPGLEYRRRTTMVRLQLAQCRSDRGRDFSVETAALLDDMLAQYESGGWQAQVIEILLLQSLVSALQGRSDVALTRLERALGLAEPEGFVRIFVDEGEPMAALLHQARRPSRYPDYIDTLLAAFSPRKSKMIAETLLPEPLSEREMEVLQLMATGASNKAIGGQLFITVTTVKKHVGNILVKLDAVNRVQAVTRARELGLLY